jgi:hypothetical protein
MVLKLEHRSELAIPKSNQAHADFAIGEGLPTLRCLGVGGGLFETLDGLIVLGERSTGGAKDGAAETNRTQKRSPRK